MRPKNHCPCRTWCWLTDLSHNACKRSDAEFPMCRFYQVCTLRPRGIYIYVPSIGAVVCPTSYNEEIKDNCQGLGILKKYFLWKPIDKDIILADGTLRSKRYRERHLLKLKII